MTENTKELITDVLILERQLDTFKMSRYVTIEDGQNGFMVLMKKWEDAINLVAKNGKDAFEDLQFESERLDANYTYEQCVRDMQNAIAKTNKELEIIGKVLEEEMGRDVQFAFVRDRDIYFYDEDMMRAQRFQESNEDGEYSEDEDPGREFRYKERIIKRIMKERFPKIRFTVSNTDDKGWSINIGGK